MANREERRAQSKRERRGIEDPQGGRMRSRAGLLDEQSLQERSVRLNNRQRGEWKPSSSVIDAEGKQTHEVIPSADPTLGKLSDAQKEARKERKYRQQSLKKLERQIEERELHESSLPLNQRSVRWWVAVVSWAFLAADLIGFIAAPFLHAPSWVYGVLIVLGLAAVVALVVLTRTDPLYHYEMQALYERQEEIQAAQKSAREVVIVRNVAWWLRVLNGALTALSIGLFTSLMWWHPATWVVGAIAGVFAVSVFNLFFLAPSSADNPRLDAYGTAI